MFFVIANIPIILNNKMIKNYSDEWKIKQHEEILGFERNRPLLYE